MTQRRTIRLFGALTLASSLTWWALLPATALAADSPTVTPGSVTLTSPTTQGTVGGVATFSASAQDLNGTPEYQWWVEMPTGQWVDAQNYSPRATFTLSTPSAGDYLVAVDVLDQSQVARGDWGAVQTTLAQGIFVDSAVTVTGEPTGPVAAGTSVTVTAHAVNIYDPLYQFWVESPEGTWTQSGAYAPDGTYTFTAGASGTYRMVAYAKSPLAANNLTGALMSPVSSWGVYGQASRVVVAAAESTLVADGVAADPLTVTVEDGTGVRVADYAGTVTLSASAPVFSGQTSTTVALASGSGTVALTVPPADVGSVTITPDGLLPEADGVGGMSTESQAANITYTGTAVTARAPVGSGLALSAAVGTLNADQATGDVVTVTLTDAAGVPVAATAPQYVTLTATGAGTFSNGLPTEVVQIAAGRSSTTATVWSQRGVPGSITVTAASTGLTAAVPLELTSYLLSAPSALVIESQNGTSPTGFSYTLYTVTLVDSQGQRITSGSGASGSLTISDNIARESGDAIYEQNPQLDYWDGTGLTNGQPTGAATATDAQATVANPTVLTGQLVAGQFQFAVENTVEGPAPVTITAAANGLSAQALYAFRAGPATYAVVSGLNAVGIEHTATVPGTTVSVTAQLTDVYGNPVPAADQPLWFVLYGSYKASAPVAELPNGATGMGNVENQNGDYGEDAYMATTNVAGQATITVTVPAHAPTQDGAITVDGKQYLAGLYDFFDVGVAAAAQVVDGVPYPSENSGNTEAGLAAYTPEYVLVAPSHAVASFGAPTGTTADSSVAWPTGVSSARFSAGTSVGLTLPALNIEGASVYAASTDLWNYYGSYDGGDYGLGFEEFILRSSNPAVAFPGGSDVVRIAPGEWGLPYGVNNGSTFYGSLYLEDLQLGQAGSATVTVTAAGVPGNPSATLHVTVLPGPSIGSAAIEYDGMPITANNPVFLQSNRPVELSVVNVDAGGDPVPVSVATVVTLPGAPDGGQWETTDSGSPTTQVTIPAGATATSVWLVAGTGGVVSTIPDGSD